MTANTRFWVILAIAINLYVATAYGLVVPNLWIAVIMFGTLFVRPLTHLWWEHNLERQWRRS